MGQQQPLPLMRKMADADIARRLAIEMRSQTAQSLLMLKHGLCVIRPQPESAEDGHGTPYSIFPP